MLLVDGDIFSLATGDTAPGSSSVLSSQGRLPRQHEMGPEEDPLLKRGEKVAGLHQETTAATGNVSDEALLDLCGQTKLYRLHETPLVANLEDALQTRPSYPRSPLVQLHIRKIIEVESICRIVAILLALLAGIVRLFASGHENKWGLYLFAQPATMMLVMLFPCLPVLLFIVEALATAQLLLVAESLDTGNERVAKAHLFAAAATRVLFQRLGLQRSSPKESASRGRHEVPLRGLHFVERLGCVTELCVVDDEIICEPFAVPEEVYFKEDAATRRTVLGLYQSAGSTSFESPTWWKCFPSLKPLGLASLATANAAFQSEGCLETTPPSTLLASLVEHLKCVPRREDGLS